MSSNHRAQQRRHPVSSRALSAHSTAIIESLESRRLLSAGQLDTTFDGDGTVTYDGLGSGFTDVAVQPDGKVLAVGHLTNGNTRTYGVFRFNLDGSMDTSFGGGDGIATLPWTTGSASFELALHSDGRITVAGTLPVFGASQTGVARFTSAGIPDTTLNGSGSIAIPRSGNAPSQLAVQGDGKFLIGYSDSQVMSAFVNRYNADGTSDTGFGSAGLVLVGINDNSTANWLADLAVLPSGKILLAGYDNGGDAYVARLSGSNGELDSTFGGSGLLLDVIADGEPHAIGTLPGDAFYLAGEFYYPSSPYLQSKPMLARFTASGALDSTFGTGGLVSSDLLDLYRDVVVQPDGRPVTVCGSADFILERFTTSGAPDPSFGTNGRQISDISGYDAATDVAIAPDGRLVAAGSADDPTHAALLRLTNDTGLAQQPDGRFLLRGTDQDDLITVTPAPQGGFDILMQSVTGPVLTQRVASFAPGLIVDAAGGNDTINLSGLMLFPVTIDGGDGNDAIDASQMSGFTVFATLSGGAGNDHLVAPDKMATLLGGDGDDTLLALNTHPDWIDGGIGSDYAQVESADTVLNVEFIDRGFNNQSPYLGSPFVIGSDPVTIQAEYYDLGGEGVAYHDSGPTNGGATSFRDDEGVDLKLLSGSNYRVNNTFAEEWIEYSLEVAETGQYQIEYRVGSKGSNGLFSADLLEPVTGQLVRNLHATVTIPNTGSNENYVTLPLNPVTLEAGQYVLRLNMSRNSSYGSIGNFDWIRFSPAELPPPPPPPGEEVTLTSDVSAYVRDGSYAGDNFGSDDILVVKHSTKSGNSREAYLKFDVSTLQAGSISGATLRVFGHLAAGGASMNVAAYSAADSSWDEDALDWNNRPSAGASSFGTETLDSTSGAWHEWDVTSLVQQARDAGQQFVTIVLKATNKTDPQAWFNSDDAASDRPQLVVEGLTTEPQQALIVSPENLTVPEGAARTFGIRLAAQQPVNVVVTISRESGGDADLTANVPNVTFTPLNWNTIQFVSITAAQDADSDNGQATFTVATAGVASQSVLVTEADDDASEATILAEASYVRGGALADLNFGSDDTLVTKLAGTSGNTRETYLRFDLSGLSGPISSAKLRLLARLSDAQDSSIPIGLYSAGQASWSENTLTWDNKPPAGSTVLASGSISGTSQAWYELDLTSFIAAELAAGHDSVTLVLRGAEKTSSFVMIDSDETLTAPRLVVTP